MGTQSKFEWKVAKKLKSEYEELNEAKSWILSCPYFILRYNNKRRRQDETLILVDRY